MVVNYQNLSIFIFHDLQERHQSLALMEKLNNEKQNKSELEVRLIHLFLGSVNVYKIKFCSGGGGGVTEWGGRTANAASSPSGCSSNLKSLLEIGSWFWFLLWYLFLNMGGNGDPKIELDIDPWSCFSFKLIAWPWHPTVWSGGSRGVERVVRLREVSEPGSGRSSCCWEGKLQQGKKTSNFAKSKNLRILRS